MVETFIYFIHQTSRILLFRLSFERNEQLLTITEGNTQGKKKQERNEENDRKV